MYRQTIIIHAIATGRNLEEHLGWDGYLHSGSIILGLNVVTCEQLLQSRGELLRSLRDTSDSLIVRGSMLGKAYYNNALSPPYMTI